MANSEPAHPTEANDPVIWRRAGFVDSGRVGSVLGSGSGVAVERFSAEKHRHHLIVAMHVTAPGASNNTIIASNLARSPGKTSDEEDMKAINTNNPVTEHSAEEEAP